MNATQAKALAKKNAKISDELLKKIEKAAKNGYGSLTITNLLDKPFTTSDRSALLLHGYTIGSAYAATAESFKYTISWT